MKDFGVFLMIVLVCIVVFGGAMFGLTALGYVTKPWFMTWERDIRTHSHQYVEARKAAINSYLSECIDLPADSVQRVQLRQMIRAEKSNLPSDVRIDTGDC